MKDYIMVGGPFNGKRVSLPIEMVEHFVADVSRNTRHRYVKAIIQGSEGEEEVFLLDSIQGPAAAVALAIAKAIRGA